MSEDEGLTLWKRLPRPLKVVLSVGVFVAGYGIYTW
jgi:hypothetical protein